MEQEMKNKIFFLVLSHEKQILLQYPELMKYHKAGAPTLKVGI